MNKELWDNLDDISAEIHSQFDAAGASTHVPQSTVTFIKAFNDKIKVGTKALVLDRQGEYYALAVNGNYLEAVHRSFLRSK